MDADTKLIQENARLRGELTKYQNGMEEWENRARKAEEKAKELGKRLAKFQKAISAAARDAGVVLEQPEPEASAGK